MIANGLLIRTGNLCKISTPNTQEEYDKAIQKAIEKKKVWIVPEAKVMSNDVNGIRSSRNNETVVTAKLFLSDIAHADHLRQAVYRTIEDLSIKHLDLLLLKLDKVTDETLWRYWQAAEQLVNDKVVLKIGVCDFNATQLESLLSFATIPPHANQIRLSDFNSVVDKELLDISKKHNIRLLSGPLSEISILASQTKSAIEHELQVASINYVWAIGYTIVWNDTALVQDTGYIIQCVDHSSPISSVIEQ